MIRLTNDVTLISKILGYEIPEDSRALYLLLLEEEQAVGLVTLGPWDTYTGVIDAKLNTRFLEEVDILRKVSKEAVKWVWDNTPFNNIFGIIPDTRKEIVSFFQRGGFKRQGVLKDSFYDGDTHNQTIIGINKCQ